MMGSPATHRWTAPKAALCIICVLARVHFAATALAQSCEGRGTDTIEVTDTDSRIWLKTNADEVQLKGASGPPCDLGQHSSLFKVTRQNGFLLVKKVDDPSWECKIAGSKINVPDALSVSCIKKKKRAEAELDATRNDRALPLPTHPLPLTSQDGSLPLTKDLPTEAPAPTLLTEGLPNEEDTTPLPTEEEEPLPTEVPSHESGQPISPILSNDGKNESGHPASPTERPKSPEEDIDGPENPVPPVTTTTKSPMRPVARTPVIPLPSIITKLKTTTVFPTKTTTIQLPPTTLVLSTELVITNTSPTIAPTSSFPSVSTTVAKPTRQPPTEQPKETELPATKETIVATESDAEMVTNMATVDPNLRLANDSNPFLPEVVMANLPYFAGGAAALFLLLILIPIIVCVKRRRKRRMSTLTVGQIGRADYVRHQDAMESQELANVNIMMYAADDQDESQHVELKNILDSHKESPSCPATPKCLRDEKFE